MVNYGICLYSKGKLRIFRNIDCCLCLMYLVGLDGVQRRGFGKQAAIMAACERVSLVLDLW